jgi:hypothetical protein
MKAEEKRQRDTDREAAKAAKKHAREEEAAAKLAERNASKTAAELQKEEEDRALRERRRAEKATKEASLKKQKGMMLGFFNKKAASPAKAEGPAEVGEEHKMEEAKEKEGPGPEAEESSRAFWGAVNSGEMAPTAWARSHRKATSRWTTVSVMATVFPEGGDDPFSLQGAPYSEPRDVRIWPRGKFLMFDEDVRPPYQGTWSKRSEQVRARKGRAHEEEEEGFDDDI